jgi:hypothetical protein
MANSAARVSGTATYRAAPALASAHCRCRRPCPLLALVRLPHPRRRVREPDPGQRPRRPLNRHFTATPIEHLRRLGHHYVPPSMGVVADARLAGPIRSSRFDHPRQHGRHNALLRPVATSQTGLGGYGLRMIFTAPSCFFWKIS